MKVTKNKFKLIILFASVVIIPITLILYKIYLLKNIYSEHLIQTSETLNYISKIKIDIFSLLTLLVVIGLLYFCINRNIFDPLELISDKLKSGTDDDKFDNNKLARDNYIFEIVDAFNDMKYNLEESRKQLGIKTEELNDRNNKLMEANAGLEDSYWKLQAKIDQLAEAEQKYYSLVRNIPELVCIIENSGIINFVNRACLDLLGYKKTELVGKNIMELVDSQSANYIYIKKIKYILKDKNSIVLELPLIRKDGIKIITEVKLSKYMVNERNVGIQAIVRDITQRKKLEEEILQSNRELATINSISKSLISTLDLENLLKMIVFEAVKVLQLPVGVLQLIDRTGTVLQTRACAGEYFKDINEVFDMKYIGMDHQVVKQAMNSGEVTKLLDIPGFCIVGKISSQKPEGEKIREMLLVPIRVKNKKLGLLSVGFTSSIKTNDINLVSSIANNAAIAIDNALLYETSKKYFIRTIDCLIAAVEAKDSYTEGHSQRVSKYAVKLADKLGLSKEQVEDIKVAGILHDIGKIGISDNILLKPGKLMDEEYELVKQHPSISNKILYPVGFSERTLKAIAFHHERFDGRGYPLGLSGSEITIEAQIIAVADAYDAMTSNRSYRGAMGRNDALREIVSNKGSQFNPDVVDAFTGISEELEVL